MGRSNVLATGAVVLFATAAIGGGWPPDHSKANIGGQEGIAVFPAIAVAEGSTPAPFSSEECVVQLAPENALDQRFTYRCGEWFLPPRSGGYRVWLELDGRVSSFQTFLRTGEDVPYRGKGSVLLHEVVPSGFVSLRHDIPKGHTVRYLSLDRPGRGFAIRVAASSARQRAPLPPGRVVAGVFNDETNEAVSYSRPAVVEEGKTTSLQIDRPSKGSDLVVHLRKPRGPSGDREASFRVESGSGARGADVVHETSSWYVAVWYALPSEPVVLSVTSSEFSMEPKTIELKPREVTTVEARLTAVRSP